MARNVKIVSSKRPDVTDDPLVTLAFEIDLSGLPREEWDDFVTHVEMQALTRIAEIYRYKVFPT